MLVQPWLELLEKNFLKANGFALGDNEFAIWYTNYVITSSMLTKGLAHWVSNSLKLSRPVFSGSKNSSQVTL